MAITALTNQGNANMISSEDVNELGELDLAWLFGDEGADTYLTMLGWTYLDESSDQRQERVFAVAGFVASAGVWNAVRPEWKKRLKLSGIDYFRATHCRAVRGQFHHFRDGRSLDEAKQEAHKVRDFLEDTIQRSKDYGMRGFGVGIDLKDFYEVSAMPEAQNNPEWNPDYHDAAYQMVIGFVSDAIKRMNEHMKRTDVLGFVCDESPKSLKVEKSYRAFKKRFPHLAEYMRGISHLDDKKQPGLQAADLMADRAREITTEYLDNPWEGVREPPESENYVMAVRIWKKESMLKTLRGEDPLFG